jgi:hypothetical protein
MRLPRKVMSVASAFVLLAGIGGHGKKKAAAELLPAAFARFKVLFVQRTSDRPEDRPYPQ